MAKAARRRSPTQTGERQEAGAAETLSASEQLVNLSRAALDVTKKAKRNSKGLNSDNFYANKLATLRADATNTLSTLVQPSPGDTSALAELVELVFSATATPQTRLKAFQDLSHNLRTIWRSNPVPTEDQGLFPLSVLTQANRGYLVTIGRQMNGCFTSGWYDGAAVMMRRLLEIALIEAFEAQGLSEKAKDKNGNYLHLTDLISVALGEKAWALSRNSRKSLPALRDIGHRSAHGRYFIARKEDLETLRSDFRVVLEEFLHHARLL